MKGGVSAEVPTTPALDEQQLRSVTELLLDEPESDARAKRALSEASPSSFALVSRTAADTLALGIRASVRLKPGGLESR
jgi:hypothetical protein